MSGIFLLFGIISLSLGAALDGNDCRDLWAVESVKIFKNHFTLMNDDSGPYSKKELKCFINETFTFERCMNSSMYRHSAKSWQHLVEEEKASYMDTSLHCFANVFHSCVDSATVHSAMPGYETIRNETCPKRNTSITHTFSNMTLDVEIQTIFFNTAYSIQHDERAHWVAELVKYFKNKFTLIKSKLIIARTQLKCIGNETLTFERCVDSSMYRHSADSWQHLVYEEKECYLLDTVHLCIVEAFESCVDYTTVDSLISDYETIRNAKCPKRNTAITYKTSWTILSTALLVQVALAIL